MKIHVLGAMNIDDVYTVPHLLREGETVSSLSSERNAGGKGLNQAVALARAGLNVAFHGAVGEDGLFLRELLEKEGIDTKGVSVLSVPTGHAIIERDTDGKNAIILYGGANRAIPESTVTALLSEAEEDDWLVLQNEINLTSSALQKAREAGLKVVLNPSPVTDDMKSWELSRADILILNEVEGFDLTGETDPGRILSSLFLLCPDTAVVLTLGEDGSIFRKGDFTVRVPSFPVTPVDTTAAGDTFTGFFLRFCLDGETPEESMKKAAKAASVAIGRPGASPSIPYLSELDFRGSAD